jgi:threonine dehydrogenase-like Zn-dependent dehydrogenase
MPESSNRMRAKLFWSVDLLGVALLGDRKLQVKDFPKPKVGPTQALIRTEASTICGSDMHDYRSTPKELGDQVKWISGHEAAGVVEQIGESVEWLKKGDRVSVFHLYGCGYCEMCRKGFPQYCRTEGGASALPLGQSYTPPRSTGGFGEYVLAPANVCLKLPDQLGFVDGAILGCSALTAYQAIVKLGISAEDTVAVYGLGPVGMCAVIILKALGAKSVGIDFSKGRMKIAGRLGLDEVVDAADKPVERVMKFSDGQGVDAALEFSGSPEATKNAIQSVANLGKVCQVGAGPRYSEPSISPASFMSRDVWITGIYVSNMNRWFDLTNLMIRKKFTFEPVVTDYFEFSQAKEAFAKFDTLEAGKIAFVPRVPRTRKRKT